jgi:hypothetical protein
MRLDCIFKAAQGLRRISCVLTIWIAIGVTFSQPSIVLAQTATGTISGDVQDTLSAFVVGAKLTLVFKSGAVPAMVFPAIVAPWREK